MALESSEKPSTTMIVTVVAVVLALSITLMLAANYKHPFLPFSFPGSSSTTSDDLSTLSLRAANTDDYDFYVKLFPDLELDEQPASRARWTKEQMHRVYIVTVGGDGKSVGYIMGHNLKDVFFITYLLVDREWRQRGVGTRALEKLKGIGKARGFKKWGLHCDVLHHVPHKMYRKMGMTVRHQLFHIKAPNESLLRFEELRDPKLVGILADDPKEWPALEQKYTIFTGDIEACFKLGSLPIKLVNDLGEVVGFVIVPGTRRYYRAPGVDRLEYLPSLLHEVRRFDRIQAEGGTDEAHFWIQPRKEIADYLLTMVIGSKPCETYDYLEGSLL